MSPSEIHAAPRLTVADTAAPVVLAGCPNPYDVAGRKVLCGCPVSEAEPRRHWIARDGTPFFCICAPWATSSLIEDGSWYGPCNEGFACWSCARRLPDEVLLRRLVCDQWCCWCGDVARADIGYRVNRHLAYTQPPRPLRMFT